MSSLIEDMSNAIDGFLIPLRMAEGYSEEKFQEMCRAIREFNKAYADSDVLPKSGVVNIIALPIFIEGCMSLYRDEELKRIQDAAITVLDVIMEGF